MKCSMIVVGNFSMAELKEKGQEHEHIWGKCKRMPMYAIEKKPDWPSIIR